MGYTELKLQDYDKKTSSLEAEVISFIRNKCQNLRHDKTKSEESSYTGKSLSENQIPYNMEKDIDRLCMEKAISRFLKSGKKEDAFDVYFCYLEMFVGDYEKTRRMIELLSEFEANGSSLLMKHRDHYSHSVYVFCLGLAIYNSNSIYREKYNETYGYKAADDNDAACHFLEYWGLASLFHDIGYPFELPFEQVCSYFEVDGDKRSERPFVAYHDLEKYILLSNEEKAKLKKAGVSDEVNDTNELFADVLTEILTKNGRQKNQYKVNKAMLTT